METNNDEVICPNCVHQFRGIPVNVQEELVALRSAELNSREKWTAAKAQIQTLDKNWMAENIRLKEELAAKTAELDAYRQGGVTEEILRRNDGCIKLGD